MFVASAFPRYINSSTTVINSSKHNSCPRCVMRFNCIPYVFTEAGAQVGTGQHWWGQMVLLLGSSQRLVASVDLFVNAAALLLLGEYLTWMQPYMNLCLVSGLAECHTRGKAPGCNHDLRLI